MFQLNRHFFLCCRLSIPTKECNFILGVHLFEVGHKHGVVWHIVVWNYAEIMRTCKLFSLFCCRVQQFASKIELNMAEIRRDLKSYLQLFVVRKLQVWERLGYRQIVDVVIRRKHQFNVLQQTQLRPPTVDVELRFDDDRSGWADKYRARVQVVLRVKVILLGFAAELR